jgi:hypothetical protein
MKYKNIIKLRLPKIQLLAVVPTQLIFTIVKDHDEPTILLFETLFCMWECFNMGTELPTKAMLVQTLVLMQMTFLNNVRKVSRLVLPRTSCIYYLNELRALKGKARRGIPQASKEYLIIINCTKHISVIVRLHNNDCIMGTCEDDM